MSHTFPLQSRYGLSTVYESIAQAFVLTEENEIKGVSKYIDYIKKSDSEHVTDAVLDVFDVSDNGDMIVGFTDGGMNAYNQLGEKCVRYGIR